MTLATIGLLVAVAVAPMQQEATAPPPTIDLDAAMDDAVTRIIAEDLGLELVWVQERDPETGRFVATQEGEEETGYLKMLYQGTYSAPELAFMGASAIQMYAESDFNGLCERNPWLKCDTNFGSTVQQDVLITAGVYAGVKGVQRLAKKYWGVDLDEGWKNLLIFGGMTAVRGLVAADTISLNNAIRELPFIQ
jgi:hypothetical protein